jgi:hypothetical protein
MNTPLEVAMDELALIPKGSRPQNILRSAYLCMRENSLGQQPEIENDRRAVWYAAVAIVRNQWPGFVPMCDPHLLALS